VGKNAAPDFAGTIGRTIAESRPFWPGVRPPPKGAPNILRSLRRSPLFRFRPLRLAHPRADDALAAQGVRYTGKPWMASMSAGRKWRGNKVATQVERRNEHTERG
jgi:hypothetical protein